MPINLFDITPLLTPIESGCLILTPNSRLNNKLLAAYNQYCQAQGRLRWESPRAYSLNEWLLEQYQLLCDRGQLNPPHNLASEFVQQRLWLTIIDNDSLGAELINPMRLASDAHSAYRSLQRWDLPLSSLSDFGDSEQWPLVRWGGEFETLLATHGLCTLEQLQQQLINGFSTGALALENELILLGFDDIPPLQQTLFEAMAHRIHYRKSVEESVEANLLRVSCADATDEIRRAALWSQAILKQHPTATIGIISPNLGQIRRTVEAVFTEVMEPHYTLPETPRYTLPFNFSAGIPLGSTALIQDTLALLQLNHRWLEVEKVGQSFTSPFWRLGDHIDITEPLLQQLTSLQRHKIKTSHVRQLCHQQVQQAEDLPAEVRELWEWLDHSLQHIESLRRQQPRQQTASRWLTLFESQLRRLGWPGTRRLDSNEYQQMNQWYQLQEKFCHLDGIGATLTCQEALSLLRQLADSEHFQAQTPDSPIQILGVLEGAGLQFSHCWVLGMGQHNWPPAPQPNPLLPLSMQRRLAMPHADADRELAFAERLTEGYRRCAPEVVFSYPVYDGDTHLLPSSLIRDIPQADLEDKEADGWTDYIAAIKQSSRLQWLNTASGPEVTDQEKHSLRGGSQILKNQAIAPYAAFLQHRLGAVQSQAPVQGLSPAQRGQILHDTLSDLWRELKDQARLLAKTDDELDAQVTMHLERHLQNFRRREPDLLGETYIALEAQRQKRLILRWLDLEKQRPAFSVYANEEAIQVDFAGLPLTLRLDRMDQLQTGELLLIDYKTGTPQPKSWGGERPDEPQLPLYCLCYNRDVDAILFAQINAREVAIKGLGGLQSEHPNILAASQAGNLDLPEEWHSIKQHWLLQLKTLAQNFLQGDCSVDFKNPSFKRFYEDLSPIMRWPDEQRIQSSMLTSHDPQGADSQ